MIIVSIISKQTEPGDGQARPGRAWSRVNGYTQEGRLTLQGVTPDHPRGTRVRGTKQASAVAAAMLSLPGFRSAQEIHAELRRQGETVGLTTVYRHLQVLSEQGVIDTIRDPSGESLYRQCGSTAHHHHLTCRECGRSVEVEGRVVEQWAEKVSAEAGFTSVNHTVELFGLCPDHQ
jgi:Fur family transcriptional regulator, ferric uptake regulator